jgi:hypothetical protein
MLLKKFLSVAAISVALIGAGAQASVRFGHSSIISTIDGKKLAEVTVSQRWGLPSISPEPGVKVEKLYHNVWGISLHGKTVGSFAIAPDRTLQTTTKWIQTIKIKN